MYTCYNDILTLTVSCIPAIEYVMTFLGMVPLMVAVVGKIPEIYFGHFAACGT